MSNELEIGQYLSQKETAALLSVTPRTIEKWIKAGKLPAIKIERAVRVLKSDVIALIDKSKMT